jgi:hypothetical protein
MHRCPLCIAWCVAARYFGFYNGASEYGLKSLDLLGSAAAHKRFVSKFRCEHLEIRTQGCGHGSGFGIAG